jgi:hypothetical protein
MTRALTPAILALASVLAVSTPLTSQVTTRSICIAPMWRDMPPTGSPEVQVCDDDRYAIRIDDREPIDWTTGGSVRVNGLDSSARHRVRITCAGKPNQAFSFRFSDFRSQNEPCLFLNDFYKTVQLWDSKPPWCKCK